MSSCCLKDKLTDLGLQSGREAISFDPLCFDAQRLVAHACLGGAKIDGDSVMCADRELLFCFREFGILDALQAFPGQASDHFELAPYARLLNDIARTAIFYERFDVATFALEELIRCDRTDVSNAQALLLCYFGMIGQSKTGHGSELPRTEAHLKALLRAKLPHSEWPLFDRNNPEAGERWIRIVRRFESGLEYFSLVRNEAAETPWIIDFLLGHVDLADEGDHVVFELADFLKFAMRQYPAFLTDLHDHVERPNLDFEYRMYDHAHRHFDSGARSVKAKCVHVALGLLEEGRQKMIARELSKARDLLSNAKHQTRDAMRPSQRWYMSASFAVSSNRATVLDQQENWTALRIDTRFTLLAAPDHLRSYQRLSRIAEAYNTDLSVYLRPLNREVASPKKKSMAQWRKLANRAIALMSLAAIIHARRGSLTPEKLEELEHVGIEDLYSPLTVGADIMPTLPWLTPADLEEL
jgi:hypothetical protein